MISQLNSQRLLFSRIMVKNINWILGGCWCSTGANCSGRRIVIPTECNVLPATTTGTRILGEKTSSQPKRNESTPHPPIPLAPLSPFRVTRDSALNGLIQSSPDFKRLNLGHLKVTAEANFRLSHKIHQNSRYLQM